MNTFQDSKKVSGFQSAGWGFLVWSLYVPSKPGWVLSGYSDFQPQSKDMYTRLRGDS